MAWQVGHKTNKFDIFGKYMIKFEFLLYFRTKIRLLRKDNGNSAKIHVRFYQIGEFRAILSAKQPQRKTQLLTKDFSFS